MKKKTYSAPFINVVEMDCQMIAASTKIVENSTNVEVDVSGGSSGKTGASSAYVSSRQYFSDWDEEEED